MKKILFFLLLGVTSMVHAQSDTITINMVTFNPADSSVLVSFDTTGSWTPDKYEFLLNPGGVWISLSSTSVDTIRIPDANGYSSLSIRAIITTPSADTVTSNIFTAPHPLPVTWASFDVYMTDNGNKLIWKTASEKNTEYFVPEYSIDAKTWTPINGTKKTAAGNSSTENTYEFVHEYSDKISSISMVYYRIKQVDLDGKFSYSEIRFPKSTASIVSTDKNIFTILKNGKNIFIKTEKDIPVSISDLTGRKKELFSNNNIYLESGMYIVIINNSITKIVIE